MNAQKWQVYLDLQTKRAYGSGVSMSDPSEAQIVHGVEWLKSRDARPRGSVLCIGPGRSFELEHLRPLAQRLVALTAHSPEVDVLKPYADQVVACDMHDIPLASGTFDFVYSSNVLEHAIAPYCALMEVRRLLKLSDGEAYFVMPSFEGEQAGRGPFHLHCLDRNVWLELLRKTGFKVVAENRTPYTDGVTVYNHYCCVTAVPPSPHDKVLQDLVAASEAVA